MSRSAFWSPILDAWRNKVAVDLCARRGFRGGPLLDISGSHQLLSSAHVRERDKSGFAWNHGWWCLGWLSAW